MYKMQNMDRLLNALLISLKKYKQKYAFSLTYF